MLLLEVFDVELPLVLEHLQRAKNVNSRRKIRTACEAERYFPRDLKLKLSELVWHQLCWNGFVFHTILFCICWICLFSTRCVSFRSLPAGSPITQLLMRLEQSQPQSGPSRTPNPALHFFQLFFSFLYCHLLFYVSIRFSAMERDWNVNCQRMLMMPFSISVPPPSTYHLPTPQRAQAVPVSISSHSEGRE